MNAIEQFLNSREHDKSKDKFDITVYLCIVVVLATALIVEVGMTVQEIMYSTQDIDIYNVWILMGLGGIASYILISTIQKMIAIQRLDANELVRISEIQVAWSNISLVGVLFTVDICERISLGIHLPIKIEGSIYKVIACVTVVLITIFAGLLVTVEYSIESGRYKKRCKANKSLEGSKNETFSCANGTRDKYTDFKHDVMGSSYFNEDKNKVNAVLGTLIKLKQSLGKCKTCDIGKRQQKCNGYELYKRVDNLIKDLGSLDKKSMNTLNRQLGYTVEIAGKSLSKIRRGNNKKFIDELSKLVSAIEDLVDILKEDMVRAAINDSNTAIYDINHYAKMSTRNRKLEPMSEFMQNK